MVFEIYISNIHNWGSVKCYGAFKTSFWTYTVLGNQGAFTSKIIKYFWKIWK